MPRTDNILSLKPILFPEEFEFFQCQFHFGLILIVFRTNDGFFLEAPLSQRL